MVEFRVRKISALSASVALIATPFWTAPAYAQQTPATLVSVCSGVSLPPSVVTGILDPVLTGIYGPIEANLNQALGALGPITGLLGILPSPLSVDVNGLLTTAASGSDIGLSVLSANGTLVGPSDPCDAHADTFSLDDPAGISIGGNLIDGLGATGEDADAGEIDSIAIGNNAATDATALQSIAIGNDASVGAGASGSMALGAGSSATGANSVALGTDSIASRGPLPNYVAFGLAGLQNSAGEISVGAPGAERQITNVAPGSAPTDAVNLAQLQAVAGLIPTNPVLYDDASHSTVTFDGLGGTTLTNVAPGALNATSTDAVNGSQLFATNQAIAALAGSIPTNAVEYDDGSQTLVTLGGAGGTTITNLADGALNATSSDAVNGSQLFATNQQVATNTTAISNLQTDVSILQTQVINISNGAAGPVQYSNSGTPTVPNGGTATNDVTLVGGAAGPVGMHNVADGVIAAGSTDAINGGQLNATNQAVAGAQTTADTALAVANNSVQYDDPAQTSVTLGPGNAPVEVHNVAEGVLNTDAVNVGQLSSAIGNVTNIAIDAAVTQSNAYTDARITELQFDIADVGKDARAGTAAALAAAAMPQPMEPGKSMVAAGASTYRGRTAIAFGLSHAPDNGKSVFKLGVTYDSSSHVGANAGAGFQF
jgi:trimeric autotransporter adhesin